MKQFKRINIILGWVSFFIAFFVYYNTKEATVSFWDCGEFIMVADKLEVGHPPGAPTFMIVGKVFSMFTSSENIAFMINTLSALCSALVILFLFWIIAYLALKLLKIKEGELISLDKIIAIFGASFVGAMSFTFSDTVWFSAVEGEVYSMSLFCTALVFWAALKWEVVADKPNSSRWLIFIFYIIGLSIGVHLLNLLAIPAIFFIYYFKKYKPTRKGMLIALFISIIVLGFIQIVFIQQVVNIAAKFELFFVNTIKMPIHSGSIIFAIFVIAGLYFGLSYTQKKKKYMLNLILLSFTMLLFGYTTFGVILIRSNADTPIDENNPENMITLLSYLKREQYGSAPLLYGRTFMSPLDRNKPKLDGNPIYYPDERTGRYEISDERKQSIPNYASPFKMLFSRMWSSEGKHVRAYKAWTNFKGKSIRYQSANDPQPKKYIKPTMGENITFFLKYQLWWMWGRYFCWNFVGRQNDTQGHNIDEKSYISGNVKSGIDFIDSMWLGNLDKYPSNLENNPSNNNYYFLPLILGFLGIYFQFLYDKKNFIITMLLFVFTGIAISIYLNFPPYQPRERDYAFVGSFFAFSIWIGLGVVGLYEKFRTSIKLSPVVLSSGLTLICLLCVPVIMAKENWDDHDRSKKYMAREMAKNFLNSCPKNAILFTNGDNDTFPLWYVQEVEGVRTDIRVVNLMLFNTDWYMTMMNRKAYDGDRIPLSMTEDMYRQGTRDYLQFSVNKETDNNDKYYNIKDVVEYITDDSKTVRLGNNVRMNVIPVRNFMIPVDPDIVIKNGVVEEKERDLIVDVKWKTKKVDYILKNQLGVWDILANFNWERPICFSTSMGLDSYFGLHEYLQQEGFVYRLVPIKTQKKESSYQLGRVHNDNMYNNMMSFDWGGYENPTNFIDENNARFVTNIRSTFTRLAESLLSAGDTVRTKKVLDRCIKATFQYNTESDMSIIYPAQLYYLIGEKKKARKIIKRVFNKENEYAEFFFSQKGKFLIEQARLLEATVSSMQQMYGLTQQFDKDASLTQDIKVVFENIVARYQNLQK